MQRDPHIYISLAKLLVIIVDAKVFNFNIMIYCVGVGNYKDS